MKIQRTGPFIPVFIATNSLELIRSISPAPSVHQPVCSNGALSHQDSCKKPCRPAQVVSIILHFNHGFVSLFISGVLGKGHATFFAPS